MVAHRVCEHCLAHALAVIVAWTGSYPLAVHRSLLLAKWREHYKYIANTNIANTVR